MPKVRVGSETYGWGPEVEALPDGTASKGTRLLHISAVEPVIEALEEDPNVQVVRAPKLTEVFVIEDGARRRVAIGAPGGPQQPLMVWERPKLKTTMATDFEPMRGAGRGSNGGPDVPPSDLGSGTATEPPPLTHPTQPEDVAPIPPREEE